MDLSRLFGGTAPPAARFAEGRVGYAIGDIHGRADLLADMLALLEGRAHEDAGPAGKPIAVFLGDYVDRGPDSAGVVELLLQGRPYGYERRFLKGNHEQAMLAFLESPAANHAWLRTGGNETLVSYRVQPPPPVGAGPEDWAEAAAALAACMPGVHREFFDSLERYVVLGDYAFVHAGVDPGHSIEDQTDADLFWARDQFIASKRRFSHRIVHGHTPVDRPYADARRVAVDTGAYASGVLSAVRLEADRLSFVSVDAAARH